MTELTEIVKACREAGAVDPPTCAFVVLNLMQAAGGTVTPEDITVSLRRKKPYLFVSDPLTPQERGLLDERDMVLKACVSLFLREFDFNNEDRMDEMGAMLEAAGLVKYENGEWVRA